MENLLKYIKFFLVIAVLLVIASNPLMVEEVFSWHECIREAAKSTLSLISAQQGVKESQAGKKVNASGFWPQIDGNVGVTRKGTEATS